MVGFVPSVSIMGVRQNRQILREAVEVDVVVL